MDHRSVNKCLNYYLGKLIKKEKSHLNTKHDFFRKFNIIILVQLLRKVKYTTNVHFELYGIYIYIYGYIILGTLSHM